jgi:DNA repair photolyase
MKVKALKDFQSTVLSMEENEVRKLELDASTLENWISSGLIEAVKEAPKKKVKANVDK